MKVEIVLAGLLCAMYASGTEGAEGVEDRRGGVYLRRVELCLQEELRRLLESMFDSSGILGAQEMVQTEKLYLRIRDAELGGYFAMAGMVLTDGVWHEKYAKVFERSELDAERDKGMVKKLMNEMATGEIWREASGKALAAKELEEDAGGAGFEGVKIMDAGEWPADRTWGEVLVSLLGRNCVAMGVAEGKYNGELRRIMSSNEELRDVLCSYILRNRIVLRSMADKNKVLAREIITGAVEGGSWLYDGELERTMEREKTRGLFGRGSAFERVRAKYGVEEELSMERLKELAQEGRLDELIKEVIRRLVRCGRIDELEILVKTVAGGRVFDELLNMGELSAVLKEGIERLIRYGRMNSLAWLVEFRILRKESFFHGLVRRGELDAALKERMGRLLRYGRIYDLKELIRIARTRVDFPESEIVFNPGEWREIMRGRRIFDELILNGELKTALRERMEALIGRGQIDDLEELIRMAEESFEGLLSRGELDSALNERMERLIRDGSPGALKMLIEIMKERSDELLSGGKLDAVLKERIEKVIEHKWIDELRMLVGIEGVKTRVSDGLVGAGELDAVFKEMARNMIKNTCRGKDGMRKLAEAMKEGVFDGLVSEKGLRAVSRKMTVQKFKNACKIA